MRLAKLLGLGVLALGAVTLQGYIAFWYFNFGGSFFGRSGFGCTAVVAVVEAVVAALAILKADELHGSLTSNPHSPLGQSLRGTPSPDPTPPPTQTAWDGGWEDSARAAEKMKADR